MSVNVLRYVSLSGYSPTGHTRHTLSGKDVGTVSALRIMQYDGDPGFYLVYFDSQDKELTDTYHETMEGAMAQAQWEFDVTPEHWNLCHN